MEELKSGKGKEKQQEGKEKPIPPLSVANVEKKEGAPHLPRWMSGQCKLLKELLGGLGEEWVAEDMEGIEGGGWGRGGGIRHCPDRSGRRGSPWDKFAWGIWVGMVRTNGSMEPNGAVPRRG